ncbi:MarR family winged helix-turn-helix transcriptional regulator [Hazenella coriacea]|uniref:MarR family transcriptional regulator n=1 Tax=Hazenella coriacea TaxID=1179467 RepID=A0A4R3L1G8_9BACL|nr:MarR family winged helix-turn-helix transcriptional regulator [Hazenella coriacea]TCS93229.1 MarR family transcriptional regulator [Hazenella coriacea]
MDEYIKVVDQINQAFERYQNIVSQEVTEAQQLKNFHLSPQQELIMFYIIRHQPVTAQEIAHHFHISKSAVSQVLAKLQDHQLIERQINAENRRESLIRLATRGEEYASVLTNIDELLVQKYYSKVPLKDLKEVLRIFNHLLDVTKKDTDREGISQ